MNGAPVEAPVRVLSLELEEGEGEKATCNFSLWDPSRRLDRLLVREEDVVVVYAGYRADYEPRGPFEVTSVKPTLNGSHVAYAVKAEEGGTLPRSVHRRVIRTGTVLDLLRRICADNGMQLVTEQALPGADLPLSDDFAFVQAGEADGEFLTRIADSFGWSVTTTNGKVAVSPRMIRQSLGIVWFRYNATDASLVQLSMERARASRVASRTQATGPDDVESDVRRFSGFWDVFDQVSDAAEQQPQVSGYNEVERVFLDTFGNTDRRWIVDSAGRPDVPEAGSGGVNALLANVSSLVSGQEADGTDLASLGLGELDGMESVGDLQLDGMGMAVFAPPIDPTSMMSGVGGDVSLAPGVTSTTPSTFSFAGFTFRVPESAMSDLDGFGPASVGGRNRAAASEKMKLKGKLRYGWMRLRPQQRVGVINAGALIDGSSYRIGKVKHRFTPDGAFSTEFEAVLGLATVSPIAPPSEDTTTDGTELMSLPPDAAPSSAPYADPNQGQTSGEVIYTYDFHDVQRSAVILNASGEAIGSGWP